MKWQHFSLLFIATLPASIWTLRNKPTPSKSQRRSEVEVKLQNVTGEVKLQNATQGFLRVRSNNPLAQLVVPSGTTDVWMNLGPHLYPAFSPVAGSTTLYVYVEPQSSVCAQLRQRFGGMQNVAVVQAAVSGKPGTAKLRIMGGNHTGSSSLSDPSYESSWNKDQHQTEEVQVVTLAQLLSVIPQAIPIKYIQTDIQGHDFAAVKSAGWDLRRIEKVTAEVWDGQVKTYQGTSNSLQTDWEPYMKTMRFSRQGHCVPAWTETKADGSYAAKEMDCTWVRLP